MPNYCNNKVTIIGHAVDLDVFEAEKLSFSKFVPRPAEEEENWLEWNSECWGTKWEHWDYEVVLRDTNILVMNFRTAWVSPINFFKSLLKAYPKVWLKCEFNTEDYMIGVWVAYMKNGICVEDGLIWDEPAPYLTEDGEIHIPGSDD